MAGGGENYDFCEYVYNPLMRQYQAMMRLMSMLRDSQSDCNDVQCFNEQDPSNPLTSLNATGSSSSFLTTYLPVMFVWALFVFALFMFRPSSMRANPNSEEKKASRGGASNGDNRYSNFRDNHDDDDNSSVS